MFEDILTKIAEKESLKGNQDLALNLISLASCDHCGEKWKCALTGCPVIMDYCDMVKEGGKAYCCKKCAKKDDYKLPEKKEASALHNLIIKYAQHSIEGVWSKNGDEGHIVGKSSKPDHVWVYWGHGKPEEVSVHQLSTNKPDNDNAKFDILGEGYNSGVESNGQNPYEPGTENANVWDEGFQHGTQSVSGMDEPRIVGASKSELYMETDEEGDEGHDNDPDPYVKKEINKGNPHGKKYKDLLKQRDRKEKQKGDMWQTASKKSIFAEDLMDRDYFEPLSWAASRPLEQENVQIIDNLVDTANKIRKEKMHSLDKEKLDRDLHEIYAVIESLGGKVEEPQVPTSTQDYPDEYATFDSENY